MAATFDRGTAKTLLNALRQFTDPNGILLINELEQVLFPTIVTPAVLDLAPIAEVPIEPPSPIDVDIMLRTLERIFAAITTPEWEDEHMEPQPGHEPSILRKRTFKSNFVTILSIMEEYERAAGISYSYFHRYYVTKGEWIRNDARRTEFLEVFAKILAVFRCAYYKCDHTPRITQEDAYKQMQEIVLAVDGVRIFAGNYLWDKPIN